MDLEWLAGNARLLELIIPLWRYKQKPLIVLLNALITVISGPTGTTLVIVLMKEILHHLIGSYSSLSVYCVCFNISCIPGAAGIPLSTTVSCALQDRCDANKRQIRINSLPPGSWWCIEPPIVWVSGFSMVFWYKQFDWVYRTQHNPKHLGHWSTKQMDFRNLHFWDEPNSGQFLYHFFAEHVLKGFFCQFGRLIKKIGVKYLWTMVQK